MDSILSILKPESFAMGFLGLLAVAGFIGFIVLVRKMRQGNLNYAERHDVMEHRIKQTTSEVSTLNKSITKEEHIYILQKIFQEAISLNYMQDTTLSLNDDGITLHKPTGDTNIIYKENMQTLRSTKKVVRGRGHFEVHTFGKIEHFYDLLALEKYILNQEVLQPIPNLPPALRKR